jgi:phosphate:Na+ symporter
VTFSLTFIDLAGAIALLLWGVHMVQSGIQRAFGASLRRTLGTALSDRFSAFAAGLGVTAALQSSTATGLIVTSFAAEGLVELMPALSAMLGANVGTTLIVQAFAFNMARVAPVFILLGVVMFRRASDTRLRDLGRVAIGLGLMMLALRQLLELITPFEDVPSLRLLLGQVATDPVVAVLLAALLTWAAHSSVAIVLLVMSFAARGVVPPDAAFALVMGANLGSAINPVLEGLSGQDWSTRRVAVGNLLNRLFGVIVGVALLDVIGPWMVTFDPDNARVVADFHTGFNVLLAVLFLPLLRPYARLLERLLPTKVDVSDPSRPRYLADAARETPTIALAAASREALRMVDVLETMLQGTEAALQRGDRRGLAETKRADDMLDRLNTAIKDYIRGLDSDDLGEADTRRITEILTFTTNLEHAGDVIERNIISSATKRLKRGVSFPPDVQLTLEDALSRLQRNLRAAAAVFMTADNAAARALVAEKAMFRDLENNATQAHFTQLRTGQDDRFDHSALHLDLLRDLKRVNAHLVAAAAYPVLEEASAGALPQTPPGAEPLDPSF